jgi:hypothetical protein
MVGVSGVHYKKGDGRGERRKKRNGRRGKEKKRRERRVIPHSSFPTIYCN